MRVMATTTPSRVTSLLAALAAVLLLATACGDDGGDEASSETTVAADSTTTTALPISETEQAADTSASHVRSELTGLLEEQIYLTGLTVETATAAGGSFGAPLPAAYEAAAAESATELSEVLGAVYGTAAGVEFNEAWDDWRAAVLGTANGTATPADVAAARAAVGALLTEFDPDADFTQAAADLATAEDILLDAVAELAAGEPNAALDLRAAADEMPTVARDLAVALVDTRGIEGDPLSEPATLRAELTGLLQESALLSGMYIEEIIENGGNPSAPLPASVRQALADNSTGIGATMEPDDQQAAIEISELLDQRIDLFADYTVGLIDGSIPEVAAAEDGLDALRDEIGLVIARDYPGVSAPAVAEELVPHIETILAFADAAVEESQDPGAAAEPTSPDDLREAALAARLTARTIAVLLTTPPEELAPAE